MLDVYFPAELTVMATVSDIGTFIYAKSRERFAASRTR